MHVTRPEMVGKLTKNVPGPNGGLWAASLAIDLSQADTDPEGTSKMNPIAFSPAMNYSRSTVDEHCAVVFACVAQSQSVCLSRLKHSDLKVDVEEVEITAHGRVTEDLGIIKWATSATPKKLTFMMTRRTCVLLP
jgi:hypothetical protein